MARSLKCPKCKSANLSVGSVKCNFSAFNGYRRTPSDYSEVFCENRETASGHPCHHSWRTKSNGVFGLPKHN